MANFHQPGASQWQPGENQYFIKDEPDQFGSQDSGMCVKSELENSWSEEYDMNSMSVDSGYCTSFNMSNHEDSVVKPEADQTLETMNDVISHTSQASVFDPTNQRLGQVKFDPSHQVTVNNGSMNVSASTSGSRPFGFYGHLPVRIQPKPVMKNQTGTQILPRISHHQQTTSQQQPFLFSHVHDLGRKPARSRKSPLVPKVDEYHPEETKPSQELLAARRLFEEALITGNIVSQARYARINRRLDKMRLQLAQRSSIIQSFSQKRHVARDPPIKRARTDEKAKCSRVLYQENKRFQGRKFTWKIGINGPHKSFNKISIKKSGKKKRRNFLNRQPLTDISDESDENIRT